MALGGQAIDEGTKKVVSGADKLLATKMESAVGKIHKGAEAAREKLHEGAELAKHGTKRSLSAFTERCRKIRHKQDPPR